MKHHKKQKHGINRHVLFSLKPLAKAVQNAVDNLPNIQVRNLPSIQDAIDMSITVVAPEAVLAVSLPPLKDEAHMNPQMPKQRRSRHTPTAKELKAVFCYLFELTMAVGLTPPYNKRGIGLEALFFKAVNDVLPEDRRPTSFSSFRVRAYKSLNMKYHNRNWRTWAGNASTAPVTAPVTAPKLVTPKAISVEKVILTERALPLYTAIIEGFGMIGADTLPELEKAINFFKQRIKAGEEAKVPVKTKTRTIIRPTSPLSALVQEELKTRGLLTLRQISIVIRNHNMSHKPLAAANATLMALIRHGIVIKYSDGRYALKA